MAMVNLPTAGVDYHVAVRRPEGIEPRRARAGPLRRRVLHDGEDRLCPSVTPTRTGEAAHDPDFGRGADRPHSRPGEGRPLRRGARAARRSMSRSASRGSARRRLSSRGFRPIANGEKLAAALARAGVDLELGRARREADDARLRHARHRADRIALFLLSSTRPRSTATGRSRRTGRQARGICTSARSPRSIRATARASSPRSNARATSATTSFDPNIRPLVTPDRDARAWRSPSGRSRSRASSRRARRTSNGSIPAAPSRTRSATGRSRGPKFCIATLGGQRRGRLSRRRAADGRRAERSMSSTPSAPATASCPRCSRRWIATARWAPRRAAPTRERLQAWLGFAAKASAITCTRKGSDPPTLAEVEAFDGLNQ